MARTTSRVPGGRMQPLLGPQFVETLVQIQPPLMHQAERLGPAVVLDLQPHRPVAVAALGRRHDRAGRYRRGPRSSPFHPPRGSANDCSPRVRVEWPGVSRRPWRSAARGVQPQPVTIRSLPQTISSASGWAQAASDQAPCAR